MYEDLVKRLNAYSAEYECHGGITAEAADTIEALSKCIKGIITARDAITKHLCELGGARCSNVVERKALLINLLDRNCGYTEEEPAVVVADRILNSGIFNDAVEKPRWISVKEHLPDSEDNVLVTDGNDYYVAYWQADEKVWYSYQGGWVDTVTYWMPLPELLFFESPKEELT